MNGPNEKYGLTTSFRLPADIKRQLGNEAKARGITLSQHASSILLSSHMQVAEQSAQVEILLTERRQLQHQLAAQDDQIAILKQQLEMLSKTNSALEQRHADLSKADRIVLEKLQQNRSILKGFLSNGPTISKSELKSAGFDARYSTSVATHQGRQYFCVFDLCYSVDGNRVLIDQIEPETLC